MANSSIQVHHVSKRYRIGLGFPSLRAALAGNGSKNGGAPESEKYHWAVKDVSFEIQPGEALGIIGPNGAGKTTILKILSRVTRPTSGEMRVNGRLSALIELGAGFHGDLTGRENIFLNGAILGMRKSEIKARFDQIIDFAGIGKYLDTPVKRYSSGMYARLGFAIAAHVDPEILLVDEVLAIGDYPFQLKCYARMNELRAKGTSLIFVSHNLDAVRRVCDRGLVMYRGESIFQGSSAEAVVAYSNAIREAARQAEVEVPHEEGLSQRVMTFDAEIEKVRLLNAAGQPATVFQTGSLVVLSMDICIRRDVQCPIFAFFIRTLDGRLVYNTTTRWMGIKTGDYKAGENWRVEFTMALPLLDGEYELGADITAADLSHFYDRLERAMAFWVQSADSAQGIVDLDAQVTWRKLAPSEERM
jgi:homopolymeric O-antigen transport system ATP-binding protein